MGWNLPEQLHGREVSDHRRILIADDDDLMRSLLKHLLQNRGYEVISAVNGSTAYDLICRHQPDLVVLDVMMPAPDGFEILRRMKTILELSTIPVVMVTARAREEDITRAFQLGAGDYLVKPFLAEELLVRIKRLLPARTTSTETLPEDYRRVPPMTPMPPEHETLRQYTVRLLGAPEFTCE